MSRLKITIIGGGSYNWTPYIVRDLILEKDLDDSEICLMDIEPAHLKLTVPLAEKIIALTGSKSVVTSTGSQNEALDGADFVVVTISTGGLEAMRHDLDIPERYGIHQAVGDTVGPGGIARALRNIPVFLNLARNMERRCPSAWMINVTNPLTTITRAVTKETSIRTVGLCHGYAGTIAELADMFGVPYENITCNVAGINHFIWLDQLQIQGRDAIHLLTSEKHAHWLGNLSRNHVSNTIDDNLDSGRSFKINVELFNRFGIFPGNYQNHVAEFFSYFLKDKTLIKEYGIKMKTIAERYQWQADAQKRIEDMLSGTQEISLVRSRELVSDVIQSLSGGKSKVDVANLPNVGQISNLPMGAVVETLVKMDGTGLSAVAFGALPKELHGLIAPIVDSQELTVEAAVEGSREKALQALALDPLSANFQNMTRILEEMLESNRIYLPQFFKTNN